MDLDRLENRFEDYTRAFLGLEGRDPRPYALKIAHTRRVRANVRLLAESLSLSGEQTALAEAVALFYDIGRFPQYRDHGTFRDAVSVNHAALGVKVLLETGALAGLPEGERKIVTDAVTLHNVFVIPPGLDNDTLLFTRLIRDADKLDIWGIFAKYYGAPEAERSDVVGLSLPDLPTCSPEVLACFEKSVMVRHELIRSQNDFKLLQLSWVFDLNFPASFRLLFERKYVDQLASHLPKDEDVKRTVEGVKKYVEQKMK